jgi:hypothetical protein
MFFIEQQLFFSSQQNKGRFFLPMLANVSAVLIIACPHNGEGSLSDKKILTVNDFIFATYQNALMPLPLTSCKHAFAMFIL